MDNESRSLETPSRRKHWPLRRGRRINRVIAIVAWAGVLFVLVMFVVGWRLSILNPANLITLAFAGIGCALDGILALSGDGDVILFTGADEGQREAMVAAMAPAFSIVFWGLFLFWMAYSFFPAWRADAYLHVGILLLLSLVVYLGGYLWRRQHV